MFFVRDHPVGDSPLYLWEPIPWAMGVAHALKTSAHRGGLLQKSDPSHVVQDDRVQRCGMSLTE